MTPTAQKIQSIINQYKSLGWTDVCPLDLGGNRLPRIACWSPDDTFSIHIELHQAKEVAHYVSIFTTADSGAVAGFWYKGHDVTPAEAQAIIRIVTGQVVEIETEAVDVRLEQLLEVEAE
jgi:hypothetical protein